MLRALPRHAVVAPNLAMKALDIVVADDRTVAASMTNGVVGRMSFRQDRFYAAGEYLTWSVKFEKVASAIDNRLLQVASDYEIALRASESKSPEYGNGDPSARICIEALVYPTKP